MNETAFADLQAIARWAADRAWRNRDPGDWGSLLSGCLADITIPSGSVALRLHEAIDMNRLQLATLLSWAGASGFQGRKRLQKVVYLLQAAGCPLDCRYTLHYFGPYSRDVAEACDEIVAAGLVEETGGPLDRDTQYTYALKPATRRLLERTTDREMQRFQALGTELIHENLWTLELGSTILFFYRQSGHWDCALVSACEFKKVSADATASRAALALAQRIESRPGRQ